MAGLNFEPLDMDEAILESGRVNSDKTAQSGNDFLEKLVQLPEGEGFVLMRILPRRKGQKIYCATRIHYLTNPMNGKKRSLHCPKELVMTDRGPRWQGECIICKYYTDLWAKSEKETGKTRDDLQNKARQLKPVERYYYNVIVRSEKNKAGETKNNVGPKIFPCGMKVHAKIMAAIVGDKLAGQKEYGDITHPMTGRDFRLVKKIAKGPQGTYPDYASSKFEDPSVLGSQTEMETWLENLHDLSTLRQVKTQDVLKHELKIHLGLVKEEGVSDDLAEFRDAPAEQIREELVTAKEVKPEVKAETKRQEEELLADDDFLKEIEQM